MAMTSGVDVGGLLDDVPVVAHHKTAQEMVAASLRDAILRGVLKPRSRLTQTALARHFGVSTTPVREALRVIAADGLIRLDAHKGAIVLGLSIEDLKEIYHLRIILEPEAARLATERMSPEALARAQALNDEMAKVHDVHVFARLNRDFHALIAEGSASKRLATILGGLRDSAMRYVELSLRMHEDHLPESVVEHQAIIDALREGDGEAAARFTVEHLGETLAVIDQGEE